MALQDLPYMGGYPQKVVGKSSTQPILFGILGMFKGDEKYQGLQQVVVRPSHGKLPPLHSGKDSHGNSDRDILGHPAKTHIPGLHYGMVPFAGAFMSGHGEVEVWGREHHKEHDEEHHKEHDEKHHKKHSK